MHAPRSFVVLPVLALTFLTCGPAEPDTLMVEGDDPQLRALAARLLPEAAARSGMELRRPVRVASRDEESLERYIRHKLDEELTEETADQLVAVYSILGLADLELDLRSLLLSVYMEQVAGFYEPDSAALFVVENQPEELLEPVLLHELVHALQDQTVSLDALVATERGNDARTAAQAAREGHASLVMFDRAARRAAGRAGSPQGIPVAAFTGEAMQNLTARFPRLSDAPRIVREGILYPYTEGVHFAHAVWQSGADRASPLGSRLPESTKQVSDPSRLPADPSKQPVRLDFGASGEGPAPVFQENRGYRDLRGLIDEWSGGEAAGADPAGWAGDQFALYGTPGQWSLRWLVLWDDEASRDAFAAWAAEAAARPSGLDIRALEISGRPAIDVKSGTPPRSMIRVIGFMAGGQN